jgi:PBP4 family serine-type D-alanyl-D-alanine carboxypeptidase
MNRVSQNVYAILLFKTAGARLRGIGTWETGRDAVETMLRRRGLSDGETRIVDGSGLALDNVATAATIARLLLSFDRDLLRGPILRDSLAVPGEEGTLCRRLDTSDLCRRLRAKTGTLGRSGVHAMAGYLEGRDGEPGYAFAVLVRSGRGARDLIDGIVRDLAK